MYGGGESYGGASQFDGGGFMSTPGGMTDGGAGSFMSPSGKTSRSQTNALFPVTIKQITSASLKSQEENFISLDGQDVQNVTVVGRVLSKDVRNTETSYVVDDCTGTIPVKQWRDVEDDEEADPQNAVSVGMYVRVYGHFRSFQGVRSIMAFQVRPIKDFNEVTCHFTECIFVHLYNKRGQGGGGGIPMPGMTQQAIGGYGGGSAQQTPTRGSVGNQYVPAVHAANDNSGGNDLQRLVMSVYQDPSAEDEDKGVDTGTVISRLAYQFPEKKIRETIEFLINEGHLYSTTDEQHHKATDMGH